MTTRPCPVRRGRDICATPVPVGRVICPACTANARADLREVPAALAELDTALSQQTAMTRAGTASACPPECSHLADDPACVAGAALGLDSRASDAHVALRAVLHGWVRVWDEECIPAPYILGPVDDHPPGPMDGPCGHRSCGEITRRARFLDHRAHLLTSDRGQAALLRDDLVRHARDWHPELAGEIREAIAEAWAAVDRPPDSRVVGRCTAPECTSAVYAPDGATTARCRTCGTQHDVAALREASLATADEALVTAARLAELIGVDKPVVRQWVRRKRLIPVDVTEDGRNLYRVSAGHALKRSGTK